MDTSGGVVSEVLIPKYPNFSWGLGAFFKKPKPRPEGFSCSFLGFWAGRLGLHEPDASLKVSCDS